jgi:hypothetical protein
VFCFPRFSVVADVLIPIIGIHCIDVQPTHKAWNAILKQEHEWTMNWFAENSHVRSGRVDYLVFPKWGTYTQAYQQYKKDIRVVPGWKGRSFNIFLRFAKESKVHVARFDRYACRICYDPSWIQERMIQMRKSENAVLKEQQEHQDLLAHQSTQFRQYRDNLKPDEVLIVWDFSKIHDTSV